MSNARDKANIPALNFSSTGIDDNATSTAITIDSSENVGIGEISPEASLHINSGTVNATAVFESTDANSIVWLKDSGGATALDQVSGSLKFSTGYDTSFSGGSEAMRIDSSGNVGIGTSSPSQTLDIIGTTNYRQISISSSASTETKRVSYMAKHYDVTEEPVNLVGMFSDSSTTVVSVGGGLGATGDFNNATEIQFHTASNNTTTGNSERMRIRSDGAVHIGTENLADTDFKYYNSYTDGNVARFKNNTATNPYGIGIDFENASPDDNTRYYLFCSDSTTIRLRINSDGDVKNHDNSYGSLSDERIKQDIRDSNSQWNDIKNIRVRNFKKKDDVRQYGENAWEQIGVIAQELETVSPKLIKHSDPTPSDILSDSSFGTLYQEGDEIPEDKNVGDVKEVHQQVKGVSYSVLYMKAIKALQEAMERIETLEAKVQTLENNQP